MKKYLFTKSIMMSTLSLVSHGVLFSGQLPLTKPAVTQETKADEATGTTVAALVETPADTTSTVTRERETTTQKTEAPSLEELQKKTLGDVESEIQQEDSVIVSSEDQKKSDNLLFAALEAVVYGGVPSKSAESDMYVFDAEAYRKKILQALSALSKNPAFKKQARLTQLVGVREKEGQAGERVLKAGTLFDFLDSSLKRTDDQTQEQFLATIHERLESDLSKELLALLNTVLFDRTSISTFIRNMFIVEVAISQCRYQREPENTLASDSAAETVILNVLKEAAQEPAIIAAQKRAIEYAQRKKEAADRQKEKSALASSVQRSSGQVVSVAEEKPEESLIEPNESGIELSKDYVEDLKAGILKLTVNEDFERSYRLVGTEFVDKAGKATNALEKRNLMPLLLKSSSGPAPLAGILVNDEPAAFDPKTVKNAFKAQLVFDSDDLDKLLIDPSAVATVPTESTIETIPAYFLLKMILLDHTRRMRESSGTVQQEEIALSSFVPDELRKIKQVKELRSLVDRMSKMKSAEVKNKETTINALKEALKAEIPDQKTLVALFTELLGQVPGLQNTIAKLIKSEGEKKEIQRTAIEIIQKIKNKDFGGKTPDEFLFAALPTIAGGNLTRYKNMMTSPERLVKAIREMLEQILGKDELKKNISEKELYEIFASYGLLTKLVKEGRDEIKTAQGDPKKLANTALVIAASAQAIQAGKSEFNLNYLPFIKNEASEIEKSSYKGQLTALLQTLAHYDLDAFFKGIATALDATKLPVDYASLLDESSKQAFAQAFFALLYDKLFKLNANAAGGALIPGLPQQPTTKDAKSKADAVRNQKIYKLVIRDSLTPVVSLLKNEGALAKATPEAITRALSEANTLIDKNLSVSASKLFTDAATRDKDKEVVKTAITTFLTTQEENIKRLANVVRTAAEEAAGGGIPAAPSMEGGVPEAPSMEEGEIPAAPPMENAIPEAPPL